MSNDPPLFNGSIRNLDEPVTPRRGKTPAARMKARAEDEAAIREDRMQRRLDAAFARAVREFRASQP